MSVEDGSALLAGQDILVVNLIEFEIEKRF